MLINAHIPTFEPRAGVLLTIGKAHSHPLHPPQPPSPPPPSEPLSPVDEESALAAAVDVADFLAQHGNAISVQDAQVQVSDPGLQRDLNTRLAAINVKGQAVQAAQRRLQALVNG